MPFTAKYFQGYAYGDSGDINTEAGRIWVRASDNAMFVASGGAWRTPRTVIGSAGITATAVGPLMLGNGRVPSTATNINGLLQLPALSGPATILTSVPTTGTVFLTFDTTSRQLQVNIAGTWFAVPSMSML